MRLLQNVIRWCVSGKANFASTVTKEVRPPKDFKKPPDHIVVNRLHWITTRDQLFKYFSQFGPVKDISLPVKNDGFNRGFAYISFKNEADAQALLDANMDHKIDEKLIKVEKAGTKL